jgi:hypothetical protein
MGNLGLCRVDARPTFGMRSAIFLSDPIIRLSTIEIQLPVQAIRDTPVPANV